MKTTLFRRPGVRAALLALCTATLCAAPMMAQDSSATPPATQDNMGGHGGRGGRMGEERQLSMLTKKLNLTPDQVTQVKAIDDDTMAQAKAVRDDTSIAQADKRAKMMEIRKASQDKIRAVLTDDQKAKYDAMQAQRHEKMKERSQGAESPAAPPQ
ncbi:MAG: hypothetical protein JWQ42_944 [Edaphobacter sp.]|nr:hypothetical protein [Edaphobacter sp.]